MRSERMTRGRRGGNDTPELVVRNHLFAHNGKFYALGGTPMESSRRDTLLGRRYIVRIDNFPFSKLEDVDDLTLSRLVHHKGIPVGEMEGLGLDSHRLKVGEELADIGLILAACSYLMYSTG